MKTNPMMRRLNAITPAQRRPLIVIIAILTALAVGTAAFAFWTSTGSAAASATTGTLSAPTQVTVTSVAGSGTVTVSWTAPTSGSTPDGYFVRRTNTSTGTNAFACGTSSTTLVSVGCTDNSVPDGTYNYEVTAVYRSWTAESASSESVVVTNSAGTAATTTIVTSSAASSVVGQQVTYTATVTANGGGTPGGSVTFSDAGQPINCQGGTQTLDAAGSATCAITYTSIGSHAITASYAGAPTFDASTSNALTQTVAKAQTSVALTSSVNPSAVGQKVTYTATVSVTSPGAGSPTGSVAFRDNNAPITCTGGSQTLSGGQATCEVTYTSAASHPMTAVYNGDAGFLTSTSSVLNQSADGAATSTSVVTSKSPAVVGETVTFTATVSVTSPGAGTPTGSVAFRDGAATITCTGGNQTLNGSGIATCQAPFSTVGSRTVSAVYAGITNFNTSTGTVTQVINQAATTTVLASSANPSVVGQQVTYTATVSVTAPGSASRTGTVAFADDGGSITCAAGSQTTLNASGVATCLVTYAAPTSRSVTANYSGSSVLSGSTSATLNQTTNKASTTTLVSSSANPVRTDASVTLTATIAVSSPGTGSPTGTVDFRDGGTTISGCGTRPVSAGQATCVTSFATFGAPRAITAVYTGDTNLNGSTSPDFSQRVVNKSVAGIGFTNVTTTNGSVVTAVTLDNTNCTGLGTANVLCTISRGNNITLAADVRFVNSSNALTPLSTAVVTGGSFIETKNGTTPGTVTYAVNGAGSPRLSGTKSGNDHVYITATYTDGPISFTATLKMN